MVPSPVWPQGKQTKDAAAVNMADKVTDNHNGKDGGGVKQLASPTDTFPRMTGNVAEKVQRLSLDGVRTHIGDSMSQQRPKANFVTKLEVGSTKSELLLARDFKVKDIANCFIDLFIIVSSNR